MGCPCETVLYALDNVGNEAVYFSTFVLDSTGNIRTILRIAGLQDWSDKPSSRAACGWIPKPQRCSIIRTANSRSAAAGSTSLLVG